MNVYNCLSNLRASFLCPNYVLFMELTIDDQMYILPKSNEIKIIKDNAVDIVRIEPISMQLLEYLVHNKNEVCTSKELIDYIWQGNADVGRPALRKNIYKLRTILTSLNKDNIILNIPKKGYRLNVSISRKKKPSLQKPNLYLIIALVIAALLIIKILFPGIIHRLLH